MPPIPFTKMSGAGNDFIIIDNRNKVVPVDDVPNFVPQVCSRRLSVGADGLILIESSERVDFRWRFFNSDGSLPEMCGNGARCAARFAHIHDIAPAEMAFETVAGVIRAHVKGNQVKLNMTDPLDLVLEAQLKLDNGTVTYGSLNTGVPHVLVAVDDIEAVDVISLGREIRHHGQFSPAGTNVNFMAPLQDGKWAIRTYERGVENETLACGTGVVAAALVLAARTGLPSPVTLKTRSGSDLMVYFVQENNTYRDVYLEGEARIIYEGYLSPEAWAY